MLRLMLVLLLAAAPPVTPAAALKVFVSVAPQKTFVERIAGDRVEVRAMVRPGHNPHTYDPTPRQVEALADAALYVQAGVPFEASWLGRILAVNPDLVIVEPGRGDGAAGHGSAGDHDPHGWTDPHKAREMAAAIRDALARLDPDNAPAYDRGYREFAAELAALDADIRRLLQASGVRRFVVYHPAWGHFARRYGLTQVAIEKDGKEPGARALAELIEQARRDEVRVIFIQPQADPRMARRVAAEIGARVKTIDPLATDYVANMRRVAALIAGTARQ